MRRTAILTAFMLVAGVPLVPLLAEEGPLYLCPEISTRFPYVVIVQEECCKCFAEVTRIADMEAL